MDITLHYHTRVLPLHPALRYISMLHCTMLHYTALTFATPNRSIITLGLHNLGPFGLSLVMQWDTLSKGDGGMGVIVKLGAPAHQVHSAQWAQTGGIGVLFIS